MARIGTIIPTVIHTWVVSNDEADVIANAWLANQEKTATKGTVEVPINVGQELWDYVEIHDTRLGVTYSNHH